MSVLPSTISLHLGYRIWIAEMNFDINVIRIYKDYLKELSSDNQEDGLIKKVEDFEKALQSLRNDIDELRNEMHLLKMKLAGQIRKQKQSDVVGGKTDDHAGLKKRYTIFRKKFETLKSDLSVFVTTMHP
jgi:predicted RNase H-like nuclease (RuvC/YqgF family)